MERLRVPYGDCVSAEGIANTQYLKTGMCLVFSRNSSGTSVALEEEGDKPSKRCQRPLETQSYVVTNSYSNLIPLGLSIVFA